MNNGFGLIVYMIFIFVLMCISVHTVSADSTQVQLFSYDSSGNLIERTSQTPSVPIITNYYPNEISVDSITRVSIFGTNLQAAQVATSYPNLIISVINSTPTQILIDITTSTFTIPGTAGLIITTNLGIASVSIQIVDVILE